MATPNYKVHRALSYIQKQADSPSGQVFVDLGSGDGETVYQALKVGFQQAVGVEWNTTLYAISCGRRRTWTPDERNRSQFLCQDLFQYNLRKANVVMIFGVKPLMEPISRKLAREMCQGTFVLSYRFTIPLTNIVDEKIGQDNRRHHSQQHQEHRLLNATLIYKEEEMHIYKVQR